MIDDLATGGPAAQGKSPRAARQSAPETCFACPDRMPASSRSMSGDAV
jgi:hypothetical protein